MASKKFISSGAPWESIFGYSRAVRINDRIEFSGTVCPKPVPGNAYEQTKSILHTIEQLLQAEGGNKTDIVRTRVFCLQIDQWQEIAKAHSEFFGEHRPASSLIEVKGFIDPKYLVEIEVTAILS